MKIPTEISIEPGHEYCVVCFRTPIEMRQTLEGKRFACPHCGAVSERRISAERTVRFWIDQDRNLWHESVGLFVFNTEGKVLFFELTKFPYGLTVPAGHQDVGEESEAAAHRELQEETRIRIDKLIPIGDVNIEGDSCARGADHHRWHVFAGLQKEGEVSLDSAEGKGAQWLTLDEALARTLTVPVERCLRTFLPQLREVSMGDRAQ